MAGYGKMVGEMALIDGEPRSASAAFPHSARILVMTRESFESIVSEYEKTGIALLCRLCPDSLIEGTICRPCTSQNRAKLKPMTCGGQALETSITEAILSHAQRIRDYLLAILSHAQRIRDYLLATLP